MIHYRAKGTSTIGAIPDTIKVIRDNTSDSPSIIDVGCGEGIYGMILKSLFNEHLFITGMDVKEYPIVKYIYNKFILGNILDWKDGGNYDMALCLHTLEHMQFENAVKAIEIMKGMADSILIGLPLSRKGHTYTGKDTPDSHKWGVQDFKSAQYGFEKIHSKYNLFYWKRSN